MKSLELQLLSFIHRYGPEDNSRRTAFIVELRGLMNQYADLALLHGARPEVGSPHNSGRPKP
jgi:hypothetical protein